MINQGNYTQENYKGYTIYIPKEGVAGCGRIMHRAYFISYAYTFAGAKRTIDVIKPLPLDDWTNNF